MKCPHQDCDGDVEASTRVYLDVEQADVEDAGALTLQDVQFSHLNDHLDGMPCNVESELEVSCTEGHVLEAHLGDELRARIGAQPVGNSPRTLGVRGGLDG